MPPSLQDVELEFGSASISLDPENSLQMTVIVKRKWQSCGFFLRLVFVAALCICYTQAARVLASFHWVLSAFTSQELVYFRGSPQDSENFKCSYSPVEERSRSATPRTIQACIVFGSKGPGCRH